MLIAILAIFFAALLTPLFYNRAKVAVSVALIVLTGGVVAYFLTYLKPVVNGEVFISSFEWSPTLQLTLSFYMDGLGLFFALLISSFGFLILIYALKYMKGYPQEGWFFGYLLLFMCAMLGVVLSANLISLFVFWELTSLSSFLLIGFNSTEEKSKWGARQALLVTFTGGLALFSGFILLNMITGANFNLIEILNNPEALQSSPLLTATIILILIGAFTKSAQFPFHFWLPNAMAAPTPVSAYLHSATMVKAGVYLVFRLNPAFAGIELWEILLVAVGTITMFWGAIVAFQSDDLKTILAYTTISALGIFFMLIGAGTTTAINAAMVYVMAHALYKGALFLITGIIDHETGTRKVSQLSDLSRKMPFTTVAAVGAGLSMAGMIPFLGFIGKEALYDALYVSEKWSALPTLVLVVISSMFFVAVAIEIMYNVFFKKGPLYDIEIHEAPMQMYLPPLILGILGLLAGIFSSVFSEPLLNVAASNIHRQGLSLVMELWHGLNFVVILSVLTIGFGVALYLIRTRVRYFWQKLENTGLLNANSAYDKTINGLQSFAAFQTRVIQNGYLRNYIFVLIVLFCLFIIYLFFDNNLLGPILMEAHWENLQIYELVILAMVTTTIVVLFRTDSRLVAVATIGIIGYSIALAYTLFSAPDVAITQFLAETLTLILLILILHQLPTIVFKKYPVPGSFLFVSVLFGFLMTMISLVMLSKEIDPEVKQYFLESSVPLGQGRNVVNVILVDFRALDTLGEISVLVITMLGIIALMRIKPNKLEL
jgi:multicomponent Na+:H+ antiporter subunit A